jgi:hypothetical protein
MFNIIECSVGIYGYNCNQSCDGCLFDSCDKEDGICTDPTGCKPGWQYGQLKCNLRRVTKLFIITPAKNNARIISLRFVRLYGHFV